MAAKISNTVPFTPGSKVRPIECARKFHKQLPAAGEYKVKKVALVATGWTVELDEDLPPLQEVSPGRFQRISTYPYWAFEPIMIAELGTEPEIPGLATDIERLASAFEIPPGFSDINLMPEDLKLSWFSRYLG